MVRVPITFSEAAKENKVAVNNLTKFQHFWPIKLCDVNFKVIIDRLHTFLDYELTLLLYNSSLNKKANTNGPSTDCLALWLHWHNVKTVLDNLKLNSEII